MQIAPADPARIDVRARVRVCDVNPISSRLYLPPPVFVITLVIAHYRMTDSSDTDFLHLL